LIKAVKNGLAQHKNTTDGKERGKQRLQVLPEKNKCIIDVGTKVSYFSELNFLFSHS